jgi:26S proteasome non-ATPase regulatory subunit 9
MKRIEAGLHSYHATLADHPPTVTSPAAATESSASSSNIRTPFAKINNVAAGSPAAEAGMEKGDYIKLFGPVNALNHEKLSKLSEVVSVHEGVSFPVFIFCRRCYN